MAKLQLLNSTESCAVGYYSQIPLFTFCYSKCDFPSVFCSFFDSFSFLKELFIKMLVTLNVKTMTFGVGFHVRM